MNLLIKIPDKINNIKDRYAAFLLPIVEGDYTRINQDRINPFTGELFVNLFQ